MIGEKNMNDLISRQDAIDAVMGTKPIVFDVNRLEPHQRTKDVVKAIEQLPSAQHEPCDVCAHKDDCGDMRIYCPAERRTE